MKRNRKIYLDLVIGGWILFVLTCCSLTKDDDVFEGVMYHYIYITQTEFTDETVAEYKSDRELPIVTRHRFTDYTVVNIAQAWWDGMPLNEIIYVVHIENNKEEL